MGDTRTRCPSAVPHARSNIALALDAFTPVDTSVYDSLAAPVRGRHAEDLAKRLSVAAELSHAGASRLVEQVLAEGGGADAIGALDALVEFGRLPEELSVEQRDQAARSQIRDEILHFDRIMDLDGLADGRNLKHRREHVWDSGALAAAERLLTLTYERRVLRGDEDPEWLSPAVLQPGQIATPNPSTAVLNRNSAPQLVAVAVGPNADGYLRRLESYCGRHPLGVAIGLLDYEAYLNREPAATVVAASAAGWFGEQRIRVWTCGDALVFKASRVGHAQVASEVHQLTGDRLGGRSTAYGRAAFTLADTDRLVLVPGAHAANEATLSEVLSRPNKKARVHLNDNLAAAFPSTAAAVLKPQKSDGRQQEDAEVVREYLASRVANHPGAATLSIEVGHVHADRELGPIQERGIDIGRALVGEVAALNQRRAPESQIRCEIIPMIDDDHVVNRLSYGRYRRILAAKGVPADEIVLESSPVLLDIACDLLKVAMRHDGSRYALVRRGSNLYLESDPLRLELVEDADGDMRVGCIVYDTALTLYRTAREPMRSIFSSRTGYTGNVHDDMLATYDRMTDPAVRAAYRQRLDQFWKRPLATLAREPSTPYLDAYHRTMRSCREGDEALTVLNVLEDYYEPLELKVKRFAGLLGIEIALDCLLFSPYGGGLRGLR